MTDDKGIQIWDWKRPRKLSEPDCAIPLMVTPIPSNSAPQAIIPGGTRWLLGVDNLSGQVRQSMQSHQAALLAFGLSSRASVEK